MERGPELVRLTVYGQPYGAGSKTAIPARYGDGRLVFKDGHLVLNYVHASEFTEPWMRAVEKSAGACWGAEPPIDGALWILIDCFEARIDGHFYADGTLRPDAPAHPHQTKTHDCGKMRRAIEDAVTNARVWQDDKRVVDGHDRKHYCDREMVIYEKELETGGWREPRAVIRIGKMKHQTVAEAGIASPPAPGQEQLLAAA